MPASRKQWINCHNHTHGSLLDGISRPDVYASRAVELGQPAIVATEHGNLFSLLDMKEAAEKHGLKAIPGQEFYQARKTRHDRDEEERSFGKSKTEWEQRGPHHLTVLAVNNTGYHNLLKLSSRAYTEGYYVKPRIDFELLSDHSEGLVVLSGCLSGKIQQALLRGDFDKAVEEAHTFQSIVGKDNFFVEIMDHGIEEERRVMQDLIRVAERVGAPIVATCDSHYTNKEDTDTHDISLCISTGSKIHDENRMRFEKGQFYLKSYEEMASLFPEQYVDNSMLVYDKYELDLSFGEYHIPEFPTPDGSSIDDYFVMSVYEGAENRFGPEWRKDSRITERLDYEMNVIKQLGFENYFLIVDDMLRWARSQDIMVGPSRGSVGGCLIAFCLNITEINPLKYGLTFDRFLVYKSPVYEPQFPELV